MHLIEIAQSMKSNSYFKSPGVEDGGKYLWPSSRWGSALVLAFKSPAQMISDRFIFCVCVPFYMNRFRVGLKFFPRAK